ncbi:MAG: hypothetical protein IPK13_27810 [Deltaproteobacteria bacterium]|nr:hypothetical protein [Deltaproteobacteria bacterium]MBK8015138.1 hypothetical protein [Deltaproteobacteria bacterium]
MTISGGCGGHWSAWASRKNTVLRPTNTPIEMAYRSIPDPLVVGNMFAVYPSHVPSIAVANRLIH